MQNQNATEKKKAIRRTVLTSLSMLVSSNYALANAPGFASHSQAPASGWQPHTLQFHANVGHSAALGATSPTSSPFGTFQHHPTAGALAQQAAAAALPVHTGWQHFGLPVGSLAALTNGAFDLPGQGYQLDLGSTAANVILGSKMFHGAPSVSVNIGGQAMSFSPGAHVTAAEYVAIREVLAGGQQNLVINDGGSATGGSFSLNQVISPKVSLLVIPQSVTAFDYFSGSKPISLHGDLVNYGSIYGVSTNAAVTSGSIFAHDITNETGGLITTQLPSSMASSIGNIVSGVSLVLGASNNLTNSGTISSAGHLTLATGSGSITNNAGATLSAVQNVNLISGSGNINNAGTVSAASGNINIAALNAANSVNINGAGGTFSAQNGAINVNDADYNGTGDINMQGGNYDSQSLNLHGGEGAITGSVGEVTGTLNTTGNAAHFAADSKVLTLGNNCINGDPTYANTGDISITGDITVSEDLTIVAGGDITSASAVKLSTANITDPTRFNPSNNITLIAGAKVTTTGATTSTLPGSSIGAGTTATVDFSSGNGGNISLPGATIDTSSDRTLVITNNYNQPNGGNVTLVAYANGPTGGTITTGTIDTHSINGDGGNVTIIAGAAPSVSTTTVNVGAITTGSHGSSNDVLGSGGNVSIYAQQPTAVGNTITFNNDGSVKSGQVIPGGAVSAKAEIKVTKIDTSFVNYFGNDVAANVAGNIKIVGGDVTIAKGSVFTTQGGQSGYVSITAVGSVDTSGSTINTSAITGNNVGNSGNIMISAGSASLGDLVTGSSSPDSTQANGATIYINTLGNLSTGNINAAGGTTGTLSADVILNAGGSLTVNSAATGPAISGRNIMLAGLEGLTITAAGGATTTAIVSGGSVTAIAGASGTDPSTAVLSISGGITTKAPRPGLVEIVNNSPTTAAVNVTVGGTITTDTTAKNGVAGSVSVVSAGAIKLGNISAIATVGNSTGSQGGGVFISSGGTGTNAITVGTVNTSSTVLGASAGGSVIMISPGAKTAANPTNIKHGTVTMAGAIKGVALYASINSITAPDTLPATAKIYIAPTLTGVNAINIKPGGYQGNQNTVDLTINNTVTNLVAPINFSAGDTSITISSLTQARGTDSFSLVAGGKLIFSNNITSSANTGGVTILSTGSIETKNNASLNLGSNGVALVFAPTEGITANTLSITAFNDIVVAGKVDLSNNSGDGHSLTLNSTIGGITTGDITTFSSGVGTNAGSVTLIATSAVSTGNIDASSYNGVAFNTTGGGDIFMQAGIGSGSSGNSVKSGNLTNGGNGLITLTAAGNRSAIMIGDIVSPYNTSSAIDSVSINGNGFVRIGSVTTATNVAGNSGSIFISSGQGGSLIGALNTSNSAGGFAGNVSLYTVGAIATIAVNSVNASTTGSAGNGGGGTLLVGNLNGNFTWGPGGIDTSANYTAAGNGNGGNVLITTNGGMYGNGIVTSATNVGGSGNGGNVYMSGKYVYMSSIDTSAFGPGATSGTGGDITIGTQSGSGTALQTTSLTTKGIDKGGSIYEQTTGFIVNAGTGVDTSSKSVAGSYTALAGGVFFAQQIVASASTSTAGAATGGNVMIVSQTEFILLNGAIDTTAKSNGGNTLAGSVGLTTGKSLNGGLVVDMPTINTSATNTGVTGASIAGDIFVSSAGAIGTVTAPNLNSSSTGGSSQSPGQIYLGSGTSNFNFSTSGGNTPAAKQFTSGTPISGSSATIKVTQTSINIVPGIYGSIGSSGSPVNLTLDFGGDSRLLVPIVSNSNNGGIFLSGLTATNTVGGTQAYQKNGYDAHFVNTGGAADSIIISGNLTSTPFAGGVQGNIQLADLTGSIVQTAGLITANHLTLSSNFSIGTSGAYPNPIQAINTDAQSLTAVGFSGNIGFFGRNVNITTPTTGTITLVGINAAAGGSNQFNFTSTGNSANIQLAGNGVILAEQTNIKASGVGSSITVAGSILAYDEFSKTQIQTSSLTLNPTGRIDASAILIQTSNLHNDGIISTTTGTLAVNNSNIVNPDLAIAGTGSLVSTTAVSISTVGNLDFSGLINGGALTTLPGESLLLVAGGDIRAQGNNTNFEINTSTKGARGGDVIMLAGVKYTFPAGGFNDLSVSSNDLATATGGSIILDGSDGGYKLTNIDTSSAGGAAGTVMLIAAGSATTNNVILLPSSGSITASGATRNGDVALIAYGKNFTGSGIAVQVGSVNTAGAAAAAGTGGIDLETGILDAGQTLSFSNGVYSTNSVPGQLPTTKTSGKGDITSNTLQTDTGYLVVDADGDVTLPFTSAALNANDIELASHNGNLTIGDNQITALPALDGSGNGGRIELTGGKSIIYANSGTSPLILNADAAAGSFGDGGIISYTTGNTTPVTFGNAAGNIEMFARSGTQGGDGGTNKVVTGGNLVLDSNFYSAAPRGANGGGAFYHFEGTNITINGLAPGQPFVLNANGVGTGDGGFIDFIQNNSAPLEIKSTTFQFSATSGLLGGDGGGVTFFTGGDLKVDPTQIKVNPLGKLGAGGDVWLRAGYQGTGNLLVTAPIAVPGKGAAPGGEVDLYSNSPTEFQIGAKTLATAGTNGIVGVPTVAGKPNGTLSIHNDGGGVKNLVALSAYGFLDLQSGGIGNVTLGASIGSTTTSVFLHATGTGNVTNTSKTITVTGGLQIGAANGDIIGAGNTPFTISAPTLRLDNSNNANILDKVSVTLLGDPTAGPAKINIANNLTLNGSKDIYTIYEVNALSLNITSAGKVGLSSFASANPLPINVSNLSVSGAGTFVLENSNIGTLSVDSVVKVKSLTLGSGGDIVVPNAIGSTTSIMSLTARNGGNLNTTGATGMIIGKSVSVNALLNTVPVGGTGAIGNISPIKINAATVLSQSSTSTKIALYAATTTLNDNIAYNGDLEISTGVGSAAKVIQTLAATTKAPGGTLESIHGHLTVQNNNTTSGSIVIGKGSDIATAGLGGGDVIFSIGPAGGSPLKGTAPTGVVYLIDGNPAPPASGQFYFNKGITVAGTSATPGKETIALNSIGGAKIIFDTGALKATAIKINGNTPTSRTKITADPPPIGSAPLAVEAPSTLLPAISSPAMGSTAPISVSPQQSLSAPSIVSTTTPSYSPVITNSQQPAAINISTIASISSMPTAVVGNSGLAGVSVSSITSQATQQLGISNLVNTQSQAPTIAWASETELTTGEIPAIVYSEEDLGVRSENSTIVDMQTVKETRHVTLNRGSVVFAPASDTIVETPMGSIAVGANSVVLVTVNGQGTAVYDLDDARHNSVRVTTGGSEVSLSPGRHLLLTDKLNAGFADVNPAQMIGYRNIREHRHTANIKAFTAEFAVPHAVSVVQPVKQMFNCRNDRSRKLSSHMLKTMSIMMTLEGGRGGYQQMLKPKLTAWAK